MNQESISIEKIKELLNFHNIPYELMKINNELFSRVIKFNLNDVDYYITWWKNVSYLSIGHKHANLKAFNVVKFDTNNPQYVNGLKFYSFTSDDYNDSTYVAIKMHGWQND